MAREERGQTRRVKKRERGAQKSQLPIPEAQSHRYEPMFTVRGQPYHLIGPLNAEQQDRARFAQIYFFDDSEIQVNARTGLYPGSRRHLVETPQSFVEENNAIFREFQTAMERMPATANRIVMPSEIVPAGDHPGRTIDRLLTSLPFSWSTERQNREISF